MGISVLLINSGILKARRSSRSAWSAGAQGYIVCRQSKSNNKLDKESPAFYYHRGPAILNNACANSSPSGMLGLIFK